MRLGIVSDLHLNFSGLDLPVDDLDILVIAGDTSPVHTQVAHWLERTVPPELPVVMVMGNHDYEGQRIRQAVANLRHCLAERQLDNVHLLADEATVIAGVRFLGTTLWTQFDAFEPGIPRHVAAQSAAYQISDFRSILGKDGGYLAPSEMAAAHRAARRFLRQELGRPFSGKTVVVSHFLPSTRCCVGQFKDSPLNPYFATDSDDLVERADLWIHGHTHASIDLEIRGTRVVCNPRGYSRQFGLAENPEWDPACRVNLLEP